MNSSAACKRINPSIVGRRLDSRDAVAAGRISMAMTRMAPTASKALTMTIESQP